MTRTFIGLIGDYIPGIEAAVIYLNRRGFKHFGDRKIFPNEIQDMLSTSPELRQDPCMLLDAALADKDKNHAVIESIRTLDEFDRIKAAAENAGIKFLFFAVSRRHDMTICAAMADGLFFHNSNLENFYRQLDPHMETIFE